MHISGYSFCVEPRWASILSHFLLFWVMCIFASRRNHRKYFDFHQHCLHHFLPSKIGKIFPVKTLVLCNAFVTIWPSSAFQFKIWTAEMWSVFNLRGYAIANALLRSCVNFSIWLFSPNGSKMQTHGVIFFFNKNSVRQRRVRACRRSSSFNKSYHQY